MKYYTHPDMPGLHGGTPFTLNGVQHMSSWWGTVTEDEIAALGFVEFVPGAPTLDERKQQMLSTIRNKRWQVETSGITVAGSSILTDDKSQARITGAAMLFDKDPDLTHVDWEAQPNVWVTVDKETMLAIGLAVGRHVQACFSRARALSEAVLAAESHEELDLIDIEASWPS